MSSKLYSGSGLEYWNNAMMEYWVQKTSDRSIDAIRFSKTINPVFQHSNIPFNHMNSYI